ncbi:DUF1758 domain-containing protein [Trichonephila clavipes]|uniref:DUF1758 domain-containing protein n=1 Tax=Trichonephila clavipes TaxID=2585209 RepID=A0A8X6V8C9_TRICX|nr:DUF1758 domain-containing protein [Trichonephila clavipes]
MVESCFQEDFLKAWNRSATSEASTDVKERLTNLMAFLKAETEGEERINLAMSIFGLGVDENRQSFKKKAKNQDSYRRENEGPKVEVNMADNTSSPRVFLLTLQLKMVCGNKEIPVRTILDSGSQMSYVLKNVVEKMGYIPRRKDILMHSLFGGIKSDKCKHTCYRIRLRNQDNSDTCNLEALDQTSICDNIASVTPCSLSLSLSLLDFRT